MAYTTFSRLINRKRRIQTNTEAFPTEPVTGDFFFDSFSNVEWVFQTNQWYYAQFTTTTSTSTSTTSTSTSTTSTSSSTSSSTSTSTTTSTYTTTTL